LRNQFLQASFKEIGKTFFHFTAFGIINIHHFFFVTELLFFVPPLKCYPLEISFRRFRDVMRFHHDCRR
jgi:hypothetical protein